MCNERDVPVIELETTPDQVHPLVSRGPRFGILLLVKQIEARSSWVLRAQSPSLESRLPILWTNSYLGATVGDATLQLVKRYVGNQKNA